MVSYLIPNAVSTKCSKSTSLMKYNLISTSHVASELLEEHSDATTMLKSELEQVYLCNPAEIRHLWFSVGLLSP